MTSCWRSRTYLDIWYLVDNVPFTRYLETWRGFSHPSLGRSLGWPRLGVSTWGGGWVKEDKMEKHL